MTEDSYNVCKCEHRESWHGTEYSPTCTGWFGRCECTTFVFDHVWPPEPVLDSRRDVFMEVLKKHQWINSPYRWTGCSCDRLWWRGYETVFEKTEDMYRAHVADILIEARRESALDATVET